MSRVDHCRLCCAALGLALALSSCCPSKALVVDDAGPGLSLCTSDTQCPAGDQCIDGLCHLPVACSGPSCPCGDGGACPAMWACSQGVCVSPACQGVACPSGEACVGGACYPAVCDGGPCPAGAACVGGSCYPTACSGPAACEPGEVCVDQGCTVALCVGVTCPADERCVLGACVDAGVPEAGDAGSADAGTPDAGVPDAGLDAGPSDAGADAGSCYQCVTGASSCTLDTLPMDGGSCPAGYAATAPACDPCWSCTNYGEGYCTSLANCGTFTTNGTVVGTCYSCSGVPGVSTVSENDACYASQENTLAISATHGGWCPWPSGANSVACGFDGNGSGIPYSAPVVAGGCASCSFTCGGACCLPETCVSGGAQCSVSDASQCCSGTVGTCFGGTGANCCT
jgi:hypothetical protein